MKLETLLKELNNKKNGAWFKIEWTTDLNGKLCAAAKREGHVVTKNVSTTDLTSFLETPTFSATTPINISLVTFSIIKHSLFKNIFT